VLLHDSSVLLGPVHMRTVPSLLNNALLPDSCRGIPAGRPLNRRSTLGGNRASPVVHADAGPLALRCL